MNLPAWIVRLECGRWLVVTEENESLSPEYRERRGPLELSRARYAAKEANDRLGWQNTVYAEFDQPNGSTALDKRVMIRE
jgi:hypothetical protein